MDDREIIEALCDIAERQNRIIAAQSAALAQMGAVCMTEETEEVNALLDSYIGK